MNVCAVCEFWVYICLSTYPKCVFVSLGFDSTSPTFVSNSTSYPWGAHGQHAPK